MPSEGGQAPLYFFLSYAHSSGVGLKDRFELDKLVHRFHDDLSKAVLERARHPRDIVPGRSDAQIPFGSHWRNYLADALATCQSFVALYCAEYFDSQDCGMEWSAFADRIHRDHVLHNVQRDAFIPVLWLPVRTDSMPSVAKDVQYLNPHLGPEYHEHGLRYLMIHRELRDKYNRAVEFFADRVIAVAERGGPSPTVPSPSYQDLRNAFAVLGTADSTERPKVRIVVAAPRVSRMPRHCDPAIYGAEAIHWRPYLPDYRGEVAQTAKRLAESLHFYAFIESAERCRELLPTTEATAPTILIVDPWAAQLPELQQKLSAFDRRTADKGWIRLVIPWNRENRFSKTHEVDLESAVERALSRTRARCRRDTPRAADGLESVEDLIADLPSVIGAAERHYLNLAKTYPPSSSASTPPRRRPRLRPPGLGSGGLRPAAGRDPQDDEPPEAREDRP